MTRPVIGSIEDSIEMIAGVIEYERASGWQTELRCRRTRFGSWHATLAWIEDADDTVQREVGRSGNTYERALANLSGALGSRNCHDAVQIDFGTV